MKIIPSGYESDYFISIEPNQIKEYIVDMTNIAESDGDYQLDYKFDTSSFSSMAFGYYTNGYPLEELTRITIKSDSVKFVPKFKKY